MPLTYLIDEHLRGDFPDALVSAGLAKGFGLDVLQIGDEIGPSLGTKDPQLLLWCEAHDRVLISRDVKTMPVHLAEHLALEHWSPGIIIIRSGKTWHEVLDDLILLAVVSAADELRNQIRYVPL